MANIYTDIKLFDAEYYLANNPDVAAAIEGTDITAQDHYFLHGAAENRAPNAWFNVAEYKAQNPDLADVDANLLLAHFALHGMAEDRAPNAATAGEDGKIKSELLADYVNAEGNEDVKDAIADMTGTAVGAELTAEQAAIAAQHFFNYGINEDRKGGLADVIAEGEGKGLTEALAIIAEGGELPEGYTLSDADANFADQTVAGLADSIALANEVIAGATNAAELELNATYTLADTLENLTAAEAAVLEGAASYSLTDEAVDFGSLTEEQIALVQGATNAADFTYGTIGETFTLTAGTDRLTGTADDDTFNAFISQNEFTGGVSNTLSSADVLDGGAGTDSLYAEIVPEFFGVTGDHQIDVQPRTKNIEIVEFEARDLHSQSSTVNVDAKHMQGVTHIGSTQSDGDLVIENLTTQDNNGAKRNTSEMTITMDHTGPENSNDDASDLTVYFDNNYLIAGEQTEQSIQLRVVNTYQLAENEDPLMGFLSATFSVGTQEVVVNIAGSATYQDVADAINAKLAELGIDGVQANVAPARTAVFTDDVEDYTQGELAGSYNPVNIVSTNEVLAAGPIELESNIQNFDGLNTWVDGDQVTTDDPISVNIELTKVGRGGEGGDLVIGGKAEDHNADQGIAGGIEVFNVTVKGGDHLPNSLGTLRSTNDALTTVNIASEVLLGQQTFASLEIRDGFGQQPWNGGQDSLELVDASAFRGDLTLGSNFRIVDLDTLIATGGGDVDYRGISRDGHDTSVTTGSGNDSIDVALLGISDSGSTPSTAMINAGDGNNEVEVHSWGQIQHEAIITTGSGTDVIRGNGVSIDVHTGAGNDVIYAENTGNKAVIQLNAGASSYSAATGAGTATAVSAVELLYGRTVQVTVAMPEGALPNGVEAFVDGFEVTARIQASDGYLTTERDLYQAAADAINNDPVVNKLVEASVDSNGHLTVTYLVDGATALGDQLVEIEVLGDWADNAANHNNILQALKVEYKDSGITMADVAALYTGSVEDELNYIVQTLADSLAGTVTTPGVTEVTAVPVVPAEISFNVSGLVAGDGVASVTFSIGGIAAAFPVNLTAVLPTVEIDGITYDIVYDLGTESASLTQQSGQEAPIAATPLPGASNGAQTAAGSIDTQGVTEVTAVAPVAAVLTFNTAGLDDIENVFFTIDGESNATAVDLTGTPGTVTIDGVAYIWAISGTNVTLTQPSGSEAPVTGDVSIASSLVGVGSTSGTDGENFVNGGLGNDVIVLSSNAETTDTIEFDAGGFGNDTIVHFTAGEGSGFDELDFTAWLNNEFSHSGSTESIDRVDTTIATTTFTANSVVVTDFSALDTAAGTGVTLNFDTLTNAQVLAALNATTGTYTVGTAPAVGGPDAYFVGNTQKSILFVENDDNLGEYKVFEVTSGVLAGETFTGVTLVGSLDFGENQAFTIDNFA